MKTVVLCGDSYYDFDDRYPGLHWADRLTNCNVYRLAQGDASNLAIWYQIQHTPYFNPDLVLISFTSIGRIEFSKQSFTQLDMTLGANIDKQREYRVNMYDNIGYANAGYNKDKFINWMPYYIKEFELLKNSLYVNSGLDFLTKHGIPFEFSAGGFTGTVENYTERLPNSWHHKEQLQDPWFHIRDEEWHKEHAKIVQEFIND
jgi:hypothetical protein